MMSVSCVFAQSRKKNNFYNCGTNYDLIPNYFPYFPVEDDTLKVLVVFCNFPDENWDPPPPAVITQQWPGSQHLQKPDWADSIVCPGTENVWENSLTAYFRDASLGKFWLIGDVYPELYVFEHEKSYYTPPERDISYAVKELLEEIDVNVNFSQYDKFAPRDLINKRQPDGVVDFIFIVYRFINAGITDPPSYSGIAELGGRSGKFADEPFITLDGVKIEAGYPGSGAILENITRSGYLIAAHEFGHYLWGAEHPVWPGFISLMSGAFPHASERETLGWGPQPVYVGSNSTIILKDYATTGDYVKFSRGGSTYFIQNLRRSSYHFSNQFNGWHWYPDDPIYPHIRDSMIVISKPAWTVEHAFGRWDWKKDAQGNYLYDTFNDNFILGIPDRISGETIMDLIDKQCINLNGTHEFTKSHNDVSGDSNTCFDIGYNEVYSPWSSPGINVKYPNDSLAIEVLGKDENGDMIINFYFNNLTETSPAKPIGIRIEEYYSDSTGSCHPNILWQHNTEPDMMRADSSKRYTIYTAVALDNFDYVYSELVTITINKDSIPSYIDYTVDAYCALLDKPPTSTVYPARYKIKSVDVSGKVSVFSDYVEVEVIKRTSPGDDSNYGNKNKLNNRTNYFLCNYPNPFNPWTTIKYSLETSGLVNITIYNVLGKEISKLTNQKQTAGIHKINFDGSSLPSGVYFCRLAVDGVVKDVKRMLLIK
jgi:hypothetical protein